MVHIQGCFDLLRLIKPPRLQFVIQDVEVFSSLGVHTPFNFYFPLLLFLLGELLLSGLQLCLLVISELPESVSPPPGKKGPDSALDIESGLLSLLCPHLGREVLLVWLNDLIGPGINVEPRLLALGALAHVHLHAHLPHHNRRLSLVLVRLHLPLRLLGVVVGLLIRLREGVVIGLPRPIVAEAPKVRLGSVLLLDLDCYSFDLQPLEFIVTYLVVRQSDLYLEMLGHHELVSGDAVEVVLLLVLLLILLLHHLVLLHLL